MKTKKYKLNTLFIGRWKNTSEIIYKNTLNEKGFTFNFSVFELLLFCSKPRDLSSIVKVFKKYSKLDQKDAEEAIQKLIDIEFLTEENDKYSFWAERNWKNALDFHLLTSNTKFVDMGQNNEATLKIDHLKQYLKISRVPPLYKEYKESIMLPKPEKITSELGEVLLNRRTTRVFEDSSITSVQLSSILFYSSQAVKVIRDYVESIKKMSPLILTLSSYTPCEIYFYANKIEGIESGIYHYNIRKHNMHLIKRGKYNALMKKIAIGQGVENASAIFLISNVFERYMWRYRNSRAYRNLLIETSSLAQRIILTTEAIGLKQFLTPAIRDSMADNLLGLDGYSESATYLVAVGNKYKR
ncbi:MAG: SagB/ThcOx family dehydrogenase [Candidatus Levybacteria bacterium]|nr:SagB/ThcOx family dehydrogenase [Candidatus Levybacteria bacterium]